MKTENGNKELGEDPARKTPSMRRPVGVKWVLSFFSLDKVFYRRVATVATLPSALLVSDFRSVQVGRSRFSRCCHLIVDLPFHS
jgi:hypothetical protein